MALVRAKFCELLGEASSFSYDSSELFLLGMFSFIDVMLDSPMTQIMEKLPVSPLVKSALNDQSGDYAVFLDIMRFYERKQILQLDMAFREIGVDDSQVPELYLKSLKYANGLF